MGPSLADRVAPHLETVASIAPVVRATADWSEAHSRPAEAFVEAMRKAGLFRLIVPREMGGRACSHSWSSRTCSARCSPIRT